VLWSSRKVLDLVLEDQCTSPCPWTRLVLVLDLTAREGIPFPVGREWDWGGDMQVSLSSRQRYLRASKASSGFMGGVPA